MFKTEIIDRTLISPVFYFYRKFYPLSTTLIIIIVTSVISLMAFNNSQLMGRMIFNPYSIYHSKEWFRFVTGGLVHADMLHLIINMFVLYSFGEMVELYFKMAFGEMGRLNFLLLYIGGLMFSVLPTYKKNRENFSYNGLGASGAVSAVLFSFILFNPMQQICLYGLLCLPGIIFGVIYIIYCYYMNKKGGTNINHDAHMWGGIFGFCFTGLLKISLFAEFFQKLIYFRDAI
jgi:membrane associated rhomboid family serine protease